MINKKCRFCSAFDISWLCYFPQYLYKSLEENLSQKISNKRQVALNHEKKKGLCSATTSAPFCRKINAAFKLYINTN